MTLLIDAITAYLGPLLEKNQDGKTLVWEDLESSLSASKEVLKSSSNFFVSKRIDDLHKSQVQAYKEAAQKALREWARTLPLEPMEENDTEQAFVDRCVAALTKSNPPNWKVDMAKSIITFETRKRAVEIFKKYHPDEDEDGDDEQQNETGDESIEDGEEEEGEMEEESASSSNNNNNNNTAKNGNNKSGAAAKKRKGKAPVRKKGTNAKGNAQNAKGQAARKGPGGNRARRGGRGGGNAKNN